MTNSQSETRVTYIDGEEYEVIALEDPSSVTRKKRRWSIWRVLFWILVVFLGLGVGAAGVSYLTFKKIIRNGGYAEEWDEALDGEQLRDVRYGECPWQKMDVYVPKKPEPNKLRGAIMFIHGGAWIGGGRMEQAGFAKRMAKEGYLTANMEYMLYNDTDDYKDYKDQYSIEKVLDDVDLALAKLVELGKERGYEIERVALSGHSAGGHLSMLYGYTYKTRENGAPPVEIAFVAPRVGPVDFHAKTWNAEKKPRTMAWFASFMSGVKISEAQYLEPDEKTEAAIESISPASDVKPGIPPTLAAYGAKDVVVPYRHCSLLEHAFRMIKAKSIAKVNEDDNQTPVFDLLVFPNSNHMLASDPDYTLKWQGLLLAYSSRYLTDAPKSSPLDDVMQEENEEAPAEETSAESSSVEQELTP